jgi:hypothetical protein
MTGRILQLDDGQAVINLNVMIVPEFKELHDHFMKIDPTGQVLSVALCYLFALYDPESPYFNLQDYEKEFKIIQDYKAEGFNSQDPIFLKAKVKAEQLYSSPTQRLLNGLKISMDKISDYLAEADIVAGKDGNFGEIMRAHKEARVILNNYKSVEADFFKEVSKNRGNSISAIDEDDEDDF